MSYIRSYLKAFLEFGYGFVSAELFLYLARVNLSTWREIKKEASSCQ